MRCCRARRVDPAAVRDPQHAKWLSRATSAHFPETNRRPSGGAAGRALGLVPRDFVSMCASARSRGRPCTDVLTSPARGPRQRVSALPRRLTRLVAPCWAGRSGPSAVGAGLGPSATPSQAADDAQLYVVQGLPGRTVDVEVDGQHGRGGRVERPPVAGPFDVPAGSRQVTFTEDGDELLEPHVQGRRRIQLGRRAAPAGVGLVQRPDGHRVPQRPLRRAARQGLVDRRAHRRRCRPPTSG